MSSASNFIMSIFAKFMKTISFYGLIFLLLLTEQVQAKESSDRVQLIRANYQVKASFFALPITAKINVKKIEPEIYQASIKLSSPFFKVDQKETARIKQCNIELLEITSKGSRMGADDWDEIVSVSWPQKAVSYQDGKKKKHSYLAEFEPTGFTSLFAHQFVFLGNAAQQRQNEKTTTQKKSGQQKLKPLTYTQSSRGWRMDFETQGRDQSVKNKFFNHSVHADRLTIPREGVKDEDAPSVWYFSEKLGAFPLKMAMKLGVFKIETNLKTIDADTQQILQFFEEWGCSRL